MPISSDNFGNKCDGIERSWSVLNYYKRHNVARAPEVCDICGAKKKVIMSHHIDYLLPLDVLWICSRCHVLIHSKMLDLTKEMIEVSIKNRWIIIKNIKEANKQIRKANKDIDSRFSKRLSKLKDVTNLMMAECDVVTCGCPICGHKWVIRGIKPKVCPNCHRNNIYNK